MWRKEWLDALQRQVPPGRPELVTLCFIALAECTRTSSDLCPETHQRMSCPPVGTSPHGEITFASIPVRSIGSLLHQSPSQEFHFLSGWNGSLRRRRSRFIWTAAVCVWKVPPVRENKNLITLAVHWSETLNCGHIFPENICEKCFTGSRIVSTQKFMCCVSSRETLNLEEPKPSVDLRKLNGSVSFRILFDCNGLLSARHDVAANISEVSSVKNQPKSPNSSRWKWESQLIQTPRKSYLRSNDWQTSLC